MSLHFESWHPPDDGALFVVTGPSGTGKTTLVREALAVVPGLHFSVSATTRRPREREEDGRDYHFVDEARFGEMVKEGALLEWAEVYGNRYGTPRAPVEAALKCGESIILDIDMQGAEQVRTAMPTSTSIFVLPPSIAAVEARLRGRGTDAEAVIVRRMSQVRTQLAACGDFDFLVINDHLASAHDQFQAVIVAELRRRSRLQSLVQQYEN